VPVYYSKVDEEQPVFHVFLGCAEGSKIDIEDRVEKLKKRAICQDCLILMKNATWARPQENRSQDNRPEVGRSEDHRDHEEAHRLTGS
jgi:hypothetical protein